MQSASLLEPLNSFRRVSSLSKNSLKTEKGKPTLKR